MPSNSTRGPSRRVSLGAAALVLVGTAVTGVALSGPASAAAVDLGGLTFDPAKGTSISSIAVTTRSTGPVKGCPVGTQNVRGVVNGPGGWSNVTIIGLTSLGISNTDDFSVPFTDTFDGTAKRNNLKIVPGRYDISLICQNRLGTTVFGTFTSPMFFTDATQYQSTDPATSSSQTSTSLAVTPDARQDEGKPVTLTAAVTPSAAAGSVQFKDTVNESTTDVGAPVPVSGGSASTTLTTFAFGPHTFTAVFVPSSKSFEASTSNAVDYAITHPSPTGAPTSTTTLTATPGTGAASGKKVTLNASVSPTDAGGTVQFKDGSTDLGKPVKLTNGAATTDLTDLKDGSHTFTAVFVPTDTTVLAGSTSSALPYSVGAAAGGTTSSGDAATSGAAPSASASAGTGDAAGAGTGAAGSTDAGTSTSGGGASNLPVADAATPVAGQPNFAG